MLRAGLSLQHHEAQEALADDMQTFSRRDTSMLFSIDLTFRPTPRTIRLRELLVPFFSETASKRNPCFFRGVLVFFAKQARIGGSGFLCSLNRHKLLKNILAVYRPKSVWFQDADVSR